MTALADVGKAAVRGGVSDRDTMMIDYTVAVSKMPDGTASAFVYWGCLKDTYQPRFLMELDEASMRARFQALSEIANGL